MIDFKCLEVRTFCVNAAKDKDEGGGGGGNANSYFSAILLNIKNSFVFIPTLLPPSLARAGFELAPSGF